MEQALRDLNESTLFFTQEHKESSTKYETTIDQLREDNDALEDKEERDQVVFKKTLDELQALKKLQEIKVDEREKEREMNQAALNTALDELQALKQVQQRQVREGEHKKENNQTPLKTQHALKNTLRELQALKKLQHVKEQERESERQELKTVLLELQTSKKLHIAQNNEKDSERNQERNQEREQFMLRLDEETNKTSTFREENKTLKKQLKDMKKKLKHITKAGELAGKEVHRLRQEVMKCNAIETQLKSELEQAETVVTRMEQQKHGSGSATTTTTTNMQEDQENEENTPPPPPPVPSTTTTAIATTTPITEARLKVLESSTKYIKEIDRYKFQLKVSQSNTTRAEQSEMAVMKENEDLREQLLVTSNEVEDVQRELHHNKLLMAAHEQHLLDLNTKHNQTILHLNTNTNLELNLLKMEIASKTNTIGQLNKEMIETRQLAKHMESTAIMAQSEFLVLNQQLYDIGNSNGKEGQGTESTNRSTMTPFAHRRHHHPTTPASAYLKKNMPKSSAYLNRALKGVTTLQSELKKTQEEQVCTSKELVVLQKQHETLQLSCTTMTKELNILKLIKIQPYHSPKKQQPEHLQPPNTAEHGSGGIRGPLSPRKIDLNMKTPEGSPLKSTFRSLNYPPRHYSNSNSHNTSISSNATTVDHATPMEQTTVHSSSGSVNSNASFTPYSAYTPLSVKISRCDAQTAGGNEDAESDMDQLCFATGHVGGGGSKAKRSIIDALDKE